MNASARNRQNGVSLIESTIVLAIVATVLGAVAPSFDQARQRRHLEGAAAQLETDMQHARAAAVARNESVRMTFNNAAACYVVHSGAAGSCSCDAGGRATCTGNEETLRVVALGAAANLALKSNSGSILFDAIKGTVTPTATVQITAANGGSVRSIVNVMGRVRNCSPSGLAGYAAC